MKHGSVAHQVLFPISKSSEEFFAIGVFMLFIEKVSKKVCHEASFNLVLFLVPLLSMKVFGSMLSKVLPFDCI